MGEITIDTDLVTGGTVDGQEIEEITIDGCSITFEKYGTTGWFSITGGSGSRAVDLTDANAIVTAGIQFRGRPPSTGTPSTDYNGWTSSTSLSTPSVPPPPWYGAHGGKKYHRMQGNTGAGCTVTVFVGTGEDFEVPEVDYNSSHTNTQVSRIYVGGSTGFEYYAYNTVYGSSNCYAVYRVNTYYDRAWYSAANNGNLSGNVTNCYIQGESWQLNPLFVLDNNDLEPTSGNKNLIIYDDNDVPYNLWTFGPLTAGQINTAVFENIRGSGEVDARIHYVYR